MATKNWPHPVLDSSSGDYPHCAFQARTEMRQTKLDFRSRTEFDLGCESLERSIANGLAEFAVQVSCPKTAFRELYSSGNSSIEFTILEHELRDQFAVTPFVICKTPFTLESTEFAEIFAGMHFPVNVGAVLATAPATEYVADKTFDELKNISAIFEVVRHLDQKHSSVEYDLNRNKIAIFLPHSVYGDYKLFRSRTPYRELFVCSLVLPGLATAIEALGSDESDVASGLRWKRVLARQLKNKGRNTVAKEDCFSVAQELLDYPFGRALEAIRHKESEE